MPVGLWYLVTGTGNKINAHTCNEQTDYDTRIEVYSSCSNATSACLAYNDDSSSCGTMSSVSWQSVDGTYYWVFVTGYGANTGVFVLDIVEGSIFACYSSLVRGFSFQRRVHKCY